MEGDRVRCTITAVDTTEVIGYSRHSEAFEIQGNFGCTNNYTEERDNIITLQPSPLFSGKDKVRFMDWNAIIAYLINNVNY